MRITLRKTPTTLRERTVARTMRPDFGGVEDDWFVEADEGRPSTEAHAGVERS
jgi:hypothetical protein